MGVTTDKGFDEYAVNAENAPLIINRDTRYHPGWGDNNAAGNLSRYSTIE